MSQRNEAIQSLRAALSVSPDNVPLRVHLAATLLSFGQFDEAEKEFREALRLDPNQADLKVKLAQAYYQNGKTSEAMVIVEDLVKRREAPAAGYVLYARLLFREGLVSESDPGVLVLDGPWRRSRPPLCDRKKGRCIASQLDFCDRDEGQRNPPPIRMQTQRNRARLPSLDSPSRAVGAHNPFKRRQTAGRLASLPAVVRSRRVATARRSTASSLRDTPA